MYIYHKIFINSTPLSEGDEMHKIYVTDHLRRQFEFDRNLLWPGADLKLLQAKNEEELFPAIRDADALIVDKTPLTSASIEKLKKCKIIMRMGVGFDNVDIRAAAEKGIYVCNVPDFCTEEVADHTIGLLLNMARNITTYNNRLLMGDPGNWVPVMQLPNIRLRGLTLGIIGLGRIGKAVALRGRALGLDIRFYDPYVTSDCERFGAREEDLHELAKKSDIVTFHVPLTKETRHMADRSFFGSLKKGAMFINTSRGGVVKTDELYKALMQGIVSKAALDVIETEPIDFKEELFMRWLKDPLLQQRLIITPHAAFHSPDSEREIKIKVLNNIRNVLEGKQPENCVNLKHFKKKV
jgi:phosphoglycerate dehydrogenase-like enzyme